MPLFRGAEVAAEAAGAAPCALVSVRADQRATFEAASARPFEVIGEVKGFALGGADDVAVAAYLFR